jgi:hypothetical protein
MTKLEDLAKLNMWNDWHLARYWIHDIKRSTLKTIVPCHGQVAKSVLVLKQHIQNSSNVTELHIHSKRTNLKNFCQKQKIMV